MELNEADSGQLPVELLSDLSRAGARLLRERWSGLSHATRLRLMLAMVDDAEVHIERDYSRAMLVAFEDSDPEIRRAALEGLWENDESVVCDLVLERLGTEPDADVRAAVAETLGRFALKAELGELDARCSDAVRTGLLHLAVDDPSRIVRDRALESAGYFSDDAQVTELIEAAYASDIPESRLSAIRAMGRQVDSRWLPEIGMELSNSDPEVRFVAVNAAGAAGDQRLAPALVDLLGDDDAEVRMAAIGALGVIGGRLAVNALRKLVQDESPAIADAAQEALDEALLLAGEVHPTQ
jgi:HEAT repeat protein